MNQGMYGMASPSSGAGVGAGGSLRKLAAQVGRNYVYTSMTTGANGIGVPLTASVRTRVLSISGRGAMRIASVAQFTGGAANMRAELLLDGVPVVDTGTAAVSHTSGYCLIGIPLSSVATPLMWDWWPFDASAEIYVTSSVTNASYTLSHITDIHQ